MTRRWLLVVLLSSTVLGCTLHCIALDVWLHAKAVAAERPLSDPKETDPNESGCVCRGALAPAPHALHDVTAQWSTVTWIHLLPLLESPVVGLGTSSYCRPLCASFVGPSPPAGKTLRALLGSLLI